MVYMEPKHIPESYIYPSAIGKAILGEAPEPAAISVGGNRTAALQGEIRASTVRGGI